MFTDEKRVKILVIIIGIMIFIYFIHYDYLFLWKGIFIDSNVNKNLVAVDTVWHNPENLYHNDTLMPTILNDKVCICSENCLYYDYFKVFSKQIEENEDIPDTVYFDENEIALFQEVGYSLAYIHSTLVDHQIYNNISDEKHDIPKLYLYIDDLAKTESVIIVNDKEGNIFVIPENIWNEKFKR